MRLALDFLEDVIDAASPRNTEITGRMIGEKVVGKVLSALWTLAQATST